MNRVEREGEVKFGVPKCHIRWVVVPHVVFMKFKNNKISHEHIYWDQASVLAQMGILKPENLPITGIEQTKKLVELSKN
jgi:carboxymethylenebutenolidase